MENINQNIHFTVDAALIQRLGYELVAKAETAVSELIKNAYDADALTVEVDFINHSNKGGTMIITDTGIGMTYKQLEMGFMRISSSNKIHNPISNRYSRHKAGRKGIGRFATQRLAEKLTIITQTKETEKAIKLEIDWNRYVSDVDIYSISFPIEYIDKQQDEGTILILENLRDSWSSAAINRVYRYVSELLKPEYLSGKKIIENGGFEVSFFHKYDNKRTAIIDNNIAIFDKALATFEGSINSDGIGTVKVLSDKLGIDDLLQVNGYKLINDEFSLLQNIRFKIYYFIYNRYEYYNGGISKLELRNIQYISNTSSGIKLYRNGFRVLPYGEPKDDWTNINRRWANESGTTIPLTTKNLFGYVEITDFSGEIFEETSSREGLLENDAFHQLQDYMYKALVVARRRVAEKITIIKKSHNNSNEQTKNDWRGRSTEEKIKSLFDWANENGGVEDKNSKLKLIESIKQELEEISMLRVLAGMGLIIGEFSHEIKQFNPAIVGHITALKSCNLSESAMCELIGIESNIANMVAYTAYFNTTVSQNINRELISIDMLSIINSFQKTIINDLNKNQIELEIDPWDFGELLTVPMHKSEWSSILFNLYTNSKKAIKREGTKGRILIEVGYEGENIFLNFQDNGDGIPKENKDRIFNAFFTTSVPAGFNAPEDESLCGSGLGLKIVKDIIQAYQGSIMLIKSNSGYSTCFKILIPKKQ